MIYAIGIIVVLALPLVYSKFIEFITSRPLPQDEEASPRQDPAGSVDRPPLAKTVQG